LRRDVFEHVGDDVGLELDFVDQLLARLDRGEAGLGLADHRQHFVDPLAQRGDVVAVRLDVLQVRLAAGADVVDAGDFLAHRLDDRVALAERGDLGVDLLGELRQLSGARLERRDALLREGELLRRCSSDFEDASSRLS
jgi:hypothetical protein